MKAIVCKEFGPPEKLVFEELAPPRPGPTDVLVRVEAAGVNFPDVLIIQDKYQFKGKLPFVPGAELCGRVTEVGSSVSNVKPGDRVAGMCLIGGFAEEALIPAAACIPVPEEMDSVTAAGFHLVYGTVMYALKQRGQLRAGETLLVLGAAGGVGLAAVQLGKIMGARVIAAASSAEKLALCREHGADELIDYSKESLKDSVKKFTGGNGADVIFDPVGGELAQDCFSCINWDGRYLVIGFAAGQIPEIALNRLLLKGASAVGVFWGAFLARDPQGQAENVRQLYAWFEEGRLKPLVSLQCPLAQGARVLRDMMERKVMGKVVLVP